MQRRDVRPNLSRPHRRELVDTERLAQPIEAGEALDREFKGDSRPDLPDGVIYEEIVAMANADGGILLIGVEDGGERDVPATGDEGL